MLTNLIHCRACLCMHYDYPGDDEDDSKAHEKWNRDSCFWSVLKKL